jgi:chloramphenicol-sensitive protein RarD
VLTVLAAALGVAAVRVDRAQHVFGREVGSVEDVQSAGPGVDELHGKHGSGYPGAPVSNDHPPSTTAAGTAFALAAYGLWGIAPAYWKQLSLIPAPELTAWRALCSAAFGIALLVLMRRSHEFTRALRSVRGVLPIALSAALLGVNWLVFIFAVQIGRITDTSLGYYVNPLVSVALGFVVLGERLRAGQWLAVSVATAGVVWWTLRLGGLPWISTALAVSFALYGLVRKLVPISSLAGFALEMLFLAPPAMVFLAAQPSGSLALPGAGANVDWWLAASGAVTAAPLVFFASATRRLPLTAVGIFQYISPSLALLLAVLWYGEPFTRDHAIAFAFVAVALSIFTLDALRATREASAVLPTP